MAVTLTKTGATPYAIRYDVVSGTGGTATKTQAALVAELAAGPLKALLEAISTDAAWTALNNDLRFQVNAIGELSASDDTDKVVFSWSTSGPGNRVISVGAGGGNQAHRLDIRFFPSFLA